MKKKVFYAVLMCMLLFAAYAKAHEAEAEEQAHTIKQERIYPLDAWTVALIGGVGIFIFSVISILSKNTVNEAFKKALYILFVILIAGVTIYISGTTIHTNIISATKGPVHWHADFEIWACDEEIDILRPKGLTNRLGTGTVHEHNDNRIHIEGVILNNMDASLGAFFKAIGGSLDSHGMDVPANSGLLHLENGEECNGAPAKLYVFVNGKLIDNPDKYIIAPYSKVPPGDTIKFIFTEKELNGVNPYISSK